uniref:Uncharacterized protein n=1 Tax=Solanum lycopersicum TaxID=4081 RepID=A0A3Q7ERN0_SOLLC
CIGGVTFFTNIKGTPYPYTPLPHVYLALLEPSIITITNLQIQIQFLFFTYFFSLQIPKINFSFFFFVFSDEGIFQQKAF